MAWYAPKTDKEQRDRIRNAVKETLPKFGDDEQLKDYCNLQLSALDDLDSAENLIQSLWKEPQDRAIALLQEYPPQVSFEMTAEEKVRYRAELVTAYSLASEGSQQLCWSKPSESEQYKDFSAEYCMSMVEPSLAWQKLAQAQGILMLIESWCLRDRERSELGRGTETITAVCKPEEAEAVAKIASEAGYEHEPYRCTPTTEADESRVDNRDLPI